jgi:hypothetical protein
VLADYGPGVPTFPFRETDPIPAFELSFFLSVILLKTFPLANFSGLILLTAFSHPHSPGMMLLTPL